MVKHRWPADCPPTHQCRALGFEPKKEEVKKMIADIDKDGAHHPKPMHYAPSSYIEKRQFASVEVPTMSCPAHAAVLI